MSARKDSKTPALRQYRCKEMNCTRCGACPEFPCKSPTGKKVRPHLERIMAWENRK